jgi:hypothetical protein
MRLLSATEIDINQTMETSYYLFDFFHILLMRMYVMGLSVGLSLFTCVCINIVFVKCISFLLYIPKNIEVFKYSLY